ncbi:MAG: hypothetical protein KF749_09160 [Bacteroidetes bacterium]|nr:hypothetical protein [Bacteroidota bacterium]MCW5894793.1 hypothetical protein [Bacteroidota bacterium]
MTRDEIINLIINGNEPWQRHLEQLTMAEVRTIKAQLEVIVADFESLQEIMSRALSTTERIIERRETSRENSRRKVRRKKARMSLREYLIQSPSQTDMSLRSLTLCSKSGATLLLEGLTFKGSEGEFVARTVNTAKEHFAKGLEPWAGWNLHYAKGGKITAGFAWEKPFLDEVFVIGSDESFRA